MVHIREVQNNIVKGKTQEMKQGPPFYVMILTFPKYIYIVNIIKLFSPESHVVIQYVNDYKLNYFSEVASLYFITYLFQLPIQLFDVNINWETKNDIEYGDMK